MRIALLNLPVDNNFGGNLQRYALIKTLESLGHDVTFLLCLSSEKRNSPIVLGARYLKRIVKKICFDSNIEIFVERNRKKKKENNEKLVLEFIKENFNTSEFIYNKEGLKRYIDNNTFDAYVVGSDQVWRKLITREYGITSYFFDFLPSESSPLRIAYAASLGTNVNELTDLEISNLGSLYSKFSYVSVREKSALEMLKKYGWNSPEASVLIDPTFLLSKHDYQNLINKGHTKKTKGNMFCYILDKDDNKKNIIIKESQQRNLIPFEASLNDTTSFSIYQWLRSFDDSSFIVTDSFHGVVFSLIFNKPFKFISNHFRGNSRFESLFEILKINENTENLNWNEINESIECQRKMSLSFLKKSLTK